MLATDSVVMVMVTVEVMVAMTRMEMVIEGVLVRTAVMAIMTVMVMEGRRVIQW